MTTEQEWREANPNAPKDIGAFGRAILNSGLHEAAIVCSRPSFGDPKPYRIDGEISIMPAKDYLRYLKSKLLPLPAIIEKYWPEIGWETCWLNGEWV